MTSIVGTWRLVETRAKTEAGEPCDPPYGPEPMGTVWFSPNGRMQSVLVDGRARMPEGETEREYQSYCGQYTFDGQRLVTRVDAASDHAAWAPSRFGALSSRAREWSCFRRRRHGAASRSTASWSGSGSPEQWDC